MGGGSSFREKDKSFSTAGSKRCVREKQFPTREIYDAKINSLSRPSRAKNRAKFGYPTPDVSICHVGAKLYREGEEEMIVSLLREEI